MQETSHTLEEHLVATQITMVNDLPSIASSRTTHLMEIHKHFVFIQIKNLEFDALDSSDAWARQFYHMDITHAIS